MSAKETPTTATSSPVRMNSIEIHFGPDVGRDPDDECDDIPRQYFRGSITQRGLCRGPVT